MNLEKQINGKYEYRNVTAISHLSVVQHVCINYGVDEVSSPAWAACRRLAWEASPSAGRQMGLPCRQLVVPAEQEAAAGRTCSGVGVDNRRTLAKLVRRSKLVDACR